MIFEDGSEVVTRRPGADGDTDVEEVEGENDTLNERTPRQQNIKRGNSDTREIPYVTLVVLRTHPWAPPVVEEDNAEANDSEIEMVVLKKRVSSRSCC